MTERPILFSAWEVRAIVAGTKTQTRRIAKRRDGERPLDYGSGVRGDDRNPMFWFADGDAMQLPCPFGVPGDRLWVRESGWRRPERTPRMMREGADTWPKYLYSADGDVDDDFGREHKWHRRPSIHMPRWASRITLEVTDVRVQRVQDISEEDALAEGAGHWAMESNAVLTCETARQCFAALWDSIHGTGAWERNDWVFAATFRRVQP